MSSKATESNQKINAQSNWISSSHLWEEEVFSVLLFMLQKVPEIAGSVILAKIKASQVKYFLRKK